MTPISGDNASHRINVVYVQQAFLENCGSHGKERMIVQRLSSTYQGNCALFDKSTKIGTHADFHLIKKFGYRGTLKYPHGGHSNRLKMVALKFHYFSLKQHLSASLFHDSSKNLLIDKSTTTQ